MYVGFRTDASVQIGTGHVVRCLTLADALRERGAKCIFLCRTHVGHLIDLIERRGHEAVALPSPAKAFQPPAVAPAYADWLGTDWSEDATATRQALGGLCLDWIVVDHYALDWHWEQMLRQHCARLMVIDDLADRRHDCDVLLDQNLGRLAEDYHDMVPEGTAIYIGPQFALLRPEFSKLRSASLKRRQNITLKRLLVNMGGVDKDNVTGQVLAVLQSCALPQNVKITVVMGPKAPWSEQVMAQASSIRWDVEVLADVSKMAELMAESDLVIGAAGSTSWERCCLGVPTIQLILAENQRQVANALSDRNAAILLERPLDLRNLFDQLTMEKLQQISKNSSAICDGRGVMYFSEEIFT